MTPKTLIFILICLLLSFTNVRSQSANAPDDSENTNSIDTTNPQTDSPAQTFEIIPGQTENMIIKLQKPDQEIVLDFHPDGSDPTMFEIQVFLNQKLDSTHSMVFPQPETLTLSLTSESGECVITGDKGFFLKVEIQKEDYLVQVVDKRVPAATMAESQEDNAATGDTGNKTLYIGLGVTIGVCIVIAIGLKVRLVAKRRGRGTVLGEVPGGETAAETSSKADLGPKDAKQADESKMLDKSAQKCEESAKTRTESKTDLGTEQSAKVEENLKSTSTAATLQLVPAPSAKSKRSVSSETKLKVKKTSKKGVKSQQKISQPFVNSLHKSEAKKPYKEEKESREVKLSLEFDMEEQKGRRFPTEKDIRALVKKMQEEGTIGCGCDPSEESDDEDQYEAPQLPNYFCCMLCFKGKRSTIVHPCRHIFSCEDCMDDLMATYKICVLCANNVTGYEPL